MLPNLTSPLHIARDNSVRCRCRFVPAIFFSGLCLAVLLPAAAQVAPATAAQAPALKTLLDQANTASDPQEKMKLWQQAVTLARQQGDKIGEAKTLNSIGNEHNYRGRSGEALTAFQSALTAYQSAGDTRGEAETQNNIGWTAYHCDRYDEAHAAFGQSRLLFHALTNPQGEVGALYGMGLLDTDAGRLSEALSALHQALTIARDSHNPGSEADALSGIGNVYIYMGRSVDARDAFQQALTLYQAAKSGGGEAWMRFGLGRVAIDAGRPEEALESFRRALAIFSDTHNDPARAQTLNYIASVEADSGHLPAALIALQQAQQICPASEKYVEAAILSRFGSIYARMGRPDDALTAYGQALHIWHTAGDNTHEAILRDAIATIERRRGQGDAARANYALSVRLVEQIRTSLGGYDSTKQSYLTSTRYIYNDYLDFVLTPDKNRKPAMLARKSAVQGNTADDAAIATAFTLAQQTKGRSLLDCLQSGQVDLSGVLTASESAQVRDLQQASDALNTRLVKEGVENNPGAKKRYAAIQEEQRRVEGRLQRLDDTLYARHPELAVKRGAKVATVADLTSLLDADTALLEYIQITPARWALFAVTKSARASAAAMGCQVTAQYLDVPATLAADCAGFHDACADPRVDYRPLAAKLGRTLIAPVASALKGRKRLIVCPDGPLWNVPFQALTIRNGSAFLVDRFEIDYAYSATGALAAHHERANQQAAYATAGGVATARGEASLLVVANPAFGDARRFGDIDNLPGQRPIDKPSRPIDKPSRPIDKPSRPLDLPSRPIDRPSRAMAARLARGGRIAPLPGTLREAHALQRRFPLATVLTGDQAQERTVKRDLTQNRYRFVHFATHGFINDAAPMLSSLVLSQPDAAKGTAENDGFLTARELFSLRLPQTEMVTLSACNTGRGSIQSGEGVVGLTWALFAAGCPTAVVSQWSVDDACTATLMAKFYAGIKAGQPKGRALHAAAQSVAKEGSGAHRHPYYWAPFVLFGEWK